MALSAAPFALKDLGLEAEQLRQAVASLLPDSGGLVQNGDFAVTQTTTPSLGVSVGVGRAWLPGTNVSNLAGQSYSTQAQYFVLNDGAVTVNLATADSSNPRIDLVYVAMQDKFYGGAADQAVIAVLKGVAAPTPTAPTLAGGGIANGLPLANVAVAANATSILNANITAVTNPLLQRGAWTTVTLNAAFSSPGAFGGPVMMRAIDGGVEFKGVAFKRSPPIAINDTICALSLKPGGSQYFQQRGSSGTTYGLQADVNMTLYISALIAPAGTQDYISLDGVKYYP